MNILPLRSWTIALTTMFLGISSDISAQALFENTDVLQVTIEAPLTNLAKVRSDVDYLDGTFSLTNEVGESQSFDLKIRARGRFRRQKATCGFPPIRLNFQTGQVEGSVLDGQDKLKLITHCQDRRAQSEQLVLREYLAYRILQTLTDKSLRARLLHITYVNTEKDNKTLVKYGFVIEDDKKVGERIGLTSLEIESLKYSDLDPQHTNLVNLYQYLIGNTDFSLIRGPEDDDCCHNSMPFSDADTIYPVPYDFDFSGIVNAPYASPNPRFKIRKVTNRIYRGRCENNFHLDQNIAHFQSKKDEIFGLVEELNDLNKKNRAQIIKFLNAFYDNISDEKVVQRKLVKGCS